MKKFLSVVLAMAMVLGMSISVFAISDVQNPDMMNSGEVAELNLSPELQSYQDDFEEMSNEELNDYISSVVKGPQTRGATKAVMQSAWLAAAQIAINKGYKCSGTLVKYSVNNVRYSVALCTLKAI